MRTYYQIKLNELDMHDSTKEAEDLLEFLDYSFFSKDCFTCYYTIFVETSLFKKLTNYLEENEIEYTVVK